MKAVCTSRETHESEYTGCEKPKHKARDYMRVYCGHSEGHCFYIKDVRYNHDIQKFEYLYDSMMGGWYPEGHIVEARSRKGWHYDSQGYCDNPGRGY